MNKVNLCYWSEFYDSIYDHPECPEQFIIDSNKELDEWVKQQSKTTEERRKTNRKKTGKGKAKSALAHQEVILFD